MSTPIHACMAAVMEDVRVVKKGDRNQTQGFNFRGIDSVMNAVGPVLRKHHVVIRPQVMDFRSETVEIGQKRTPMRLVMLTVRYSFVGPAGDEFTVEVPGEAMDSGDKAYSKAMSVALRTALLQTLCLPTDEPDPDEYTYERSPVPADASPPIGRGEPPADTPTAARKALAAEAERVGLDLAEVSGAWKATHNTELRDSKDSKAIREFTSGLLERVTDWLTEQEKSKEEQ